MLLDSQTVCNFADYFVIYTGDTERQIRAIFDEIEHTLKKEGILPHHHEGTIGSGWLLIDYGGVVVHVFAPFERGHYQLDELWSKANLMLQIQ